MTLVVPTLLLTVLVALLRPAASLPALPTVTHDSGSVIGTRLESAGTRDGIGPRQYAAFWGVPFAQQPVGELRFKPPVRVGFPAGRLLATNSSYPGCLQQRRDPPLILGSEDCLTLQIFTPHLDGPDLPVLVFIHGGAFMYGDGPRGGEKYVMDYDVVFVTVDYRLGILGFLSFEDQALPGNLGMLDQVAALRWIQENIKHFGGDNKRITISGLSAGSASCLLHTLSPLSRGLFHRVIAMSGSPLNPWTQQRSARENGLRVAALSNCTSNNTNVILECLRSKDAGQLVALEAEHFQTWMQNPFSPFAPVVDKGAATPFMPQDPHSMLTSGKNIADVPLILSVTTEEGLYNAAEFVGNGSLVRELDASWEKLAPLLLHFHDSRVPDAEKPRWAQSIRQRYFGYTALSDNVNELVQLMGDRNFVVGVAEHAMLSAAAQSSPVYFYRFGYRGQYSLYNAVSRGVSHADDAQYLVAFPRWSGPFSWPGDKLMQQRLLEMWMPFITNGTPAMQGAAWKPIPRDNHGLLHYLFIRDAANMTMQQDEDMGHKSFWKSLDEGRSGANSMSSHVLSSILLHLIGIILIVS